MGVLGTYYFDGVSFANASMIYIDSSLSTPGPNGYYGQNGIVRELIGSPTTPVLLAALPCDSCSVPCGTGVNGVGGTGSYSLTMALGNSIGAVKVTFDPQNVPDKCTWTYDGVSASEYSSPSEGYLQGMIGTIAQAGACNLTMSNANGSNGATVNGSSFLYDAGTTQFVNTGTPVTLGPYGNQAAGGVDFTTAAPGATIMVVPKPNVSPDTVTFVIEGPCTGTGWSIAVVCPTAMTSFSSTARAATAVASCALSLTETFFNMPVSGTAGVPAINDWVFSDANGVSELPAGFYKTSTGEVFQVANGVITARFLCA